MHFGSNIFEDPKVSEKRFVRWLDSIKEDAMAIYLLGDIFDFWFEYNKVVPKGFTRFLGKIAELSDSGIDIHFFTGNHDIWMFDYFPSELGITVHREPIMTQIHGKAFYLAHGDGLGDHSKSFKIIRAIFHNRVCQILFSGVPTRWGIGFGHWWSKHNRKKNIARAVPYFGEEKEHLVVYSKEYLKQHPETDYLIYGHRHILLDLMLSKRTRMMILGDWMEFFSYAVFDGENLLLEQFER